MPAHPTVLQEVQYQIASLQALTSAEDDRRMCDVCQREELNAKVKCQECQTHLCDICLVKHQQITVLSGHNIVPLSKHTYCPHHPRDVVCVYCHDCSQVACFKCLLSHHQGHTKEDIKSLVTQSQIKIQTYLYAQKACIIDPKVVQAMKDGWR